MAYQTGSASDINDLLSKLATFAENLGWIVDKKESNLLCLHNDEGFWSLVFNSDAKELYCYVNTGFDSGKSGNAQPGSSRTNGYTTIDTSTTHLGGGNYASYDFFGTSQYLHVVVQFKTGCFRHFGIGTLNKEGSYTGGQYAFGTFINNKYEHLMDSYHCLGFANGLEGEQAVVRADGISGDSRTPWYFAPKNVNDFSTISNNDKGKFILSLGKASLDRNNGSYHPDVFMVSNSQSKFGNLIIPCPHSLIANGIDGVFRRLGVVPDRYECTMVGVSPRQILEITGERWMIIPSAGYDARNTYSIEIGKENSGIQGVAYKLVE